jgi:choline dehydrogenase-like flavoprotein
MNDRFKGDIMKASKENWDLIVIGTGPSGAAIARELSKNGRNVLILEKGRLDYSLHIPNMLRNKEMMFIGKGRTLVRGVRTGGSSILYYGTAFEPPYQLFSKHGIHLAKEVEELKSELPIRPLRDDLIGPAAKKLMESAKDLGYAWGKLDKFVYQDRPKPSFFPFAEQWNAVQFVDEAVRLGATLINGASVSQILLEGKNAIGVEYNDHGQFRKKAYASKIVLAAGGLGSAQILRNSGIDRAGEGFFCDPLILAHGVMKGFDGGAEIPMGCGMMEEREGYVLTDITLPKLVYQLFSMQALKPHRVFDHHKTISIMVKIKDELGGSIKRNGRIHKDFTEIDKQRMQKGYAKAKEILHHAGAKKIFSTLWTSAHPGGSVRIGELVDSNLQTAYDNLYVCDCSVIPAAWGLPPTLTVLALAKRLAKSFLKD